MDTNIIELCYCSNEITILMWYRASPFSPLCTSRHIPTTSVAGIQILSQGGRRLWQDILPQGSSFSHALSLIAVQFHNGPGLKHDTSSLVLTSTQSRKGLDSGKYGAGTTPTRVTQKLEQVTAPLLHSYTWILLRY